MRLRPTVSALFIRPGMTHVQEINDYSCLAAHRLAWDALLARTPEASFFQSLDWFLAYGRHFGRQERLRTLVVSFDGRPMGIVPLVVSTEPTRLGPLRVLTYPLREWGPSFGPIGPLPSVALTMALRHIGRTPRDWDVIDLRCVPVEGWDGGRTAAAMTSAGMPPQVGPWGEVALTDLSAGWDAYWSSRARRWRKNLRRCERKLAEKGVVTHVRHRPTGAAHGDADPRWDLYEACEQVAGRSWQATAGYGNTLSHPDVRPFLRDAHSAAVAAGAVDVNLLYIDERPVAFMYSYVREGRVVGLRMGYDESISRDGAGSVLVARALEDSCRRGDSGFNLGSGYLDCKRYWQTSLVATQRCTWYAPVEPRAQAVRWKRAIQARFGMPVRPRE